MMNIPMKQTVLSLAILTAVSLFAGIAWGDELRQVVTVDPGDLFFGRIAGYDIIELEGYRYPTEAGIPMLPVTIVTVAIPEMAEITGLEVVSTDAKVLKGSYCIMPSQKPQAHVRQETPGSRAITAPDPGIYGSSQPYPERVAELVNTADLDGHSLAHVRISPLQYVPRERRLVLNRRIEFVIHYQDPITEEKPHLGGIPPGDYDYAIITSSALVSAFQPLADWKTKKGVKAIIVTTGDVQNWYGGTGTSEFRSFVRDAHVEWGTAWFLIGGDVDIVPVEWKNFSGPGATYGDTYYADYNSDWVCEVAVGRASVNTTAEVQTFVDKVLIYEKDPPLTDYPLDITLIAMDLDSGTHCEETMEGFVVPVIPERFDITKVYDSDPGSHKEEVVEALNDGQNVVIHAAHATGVALWVGDDWLEGSDLADLTNYDKTTILYSMGGSAGDFEASDCFGEGWVVQYPGKVGIGFIGNAGYFWYQYGCCHCLSGQYMIAFAHSLFGEERRHLGDALSDHKNDTPPGSDEYMQYIFYELNLLGDPEMPVWLDTPGDMIVSHHTQIPVGEQDFTVTVSDGSSGIQGARVCLMKGSEVYDVAITDPSGEATLTINPATEGTLDVTVTAYDFLPYEGACEVMAVNVTLISDSPVVPRGGTLRYVVTVSNLGDSSVALDYWSDIILWNGEPYGKNPVFGPVSGKLPGGKVKQAIITHRVPNSAPLKTYTCCGRIGSHPDEIWDESCFEFTVVEGQD
jgi:hypothetical protein